MKKRLCVSLFAALMATGTFAHAGSASADASYAPSAIAMHPSVMALSTDPSGSTSPASSAPESSAESAKQQLTTPTAKVKINGSLVSFPNEYPAVIRHNRMFVPIRMFEHPDIQAQYSIYKMPDETDLLIQSFWGHIRMKIGQEQYSYFDYGTDQFFHVTASDMAPYLEGGVVMVPLRPVAEAFGFEVLWDQEDRTALLQSDEAYRENLYDRTEWEEWLGKLPAEKAYETVSPITDEEIVQYIRNKKLNIHDYMHLSDYNTLVLEVRDGRMSVYVVHRTRNGNLKSEDVKYWTGADEEGFFVNRSGGYVGIGMQDQASAHEITYAVVNFFDLNGKNERIKVTFETEQRGKLVKLPANITTGTVIFSGAGGFVHEVWFW